jgi:hypothetical protein
MEQNLVDSTIKPKKPQEQFKTKENHNNSNGDIPISAISIQRQVEKRVPAASCAGVPSFVEKKPRGYETKKTKPPSKHAAKNQEEKLDEIDTNVSTAPLPVIAFRREDERRPTPGCTALPSSIGTYFSSKQVASVIKAIQQDDDQSPSTSVDDVLDELSELQVQLDTLRLTHSVTRDVLLDASKRADTDSELLEFPPEENEEMMGGLPFQAFESKRDAPNEARATAFSKLVDVLAQHESPSLEEAFVDKGVRVRQFGSEGDGPGTPDSSFSIVIHDDVDDEYDDGEGDDSSPTLLKPQTKGSRRKSRIKMSKSYPTEISSLQKQKSKSLTLSLTRDVAADATSQPAEVDKFQPLMSPREGPEPLPPLLESEPWSPTPPYPKSRREMRSSSASIQVAEPPRKYFSSIRGALDSFVRRSKATPHSTQVSPGTKSVRFSKKLVASVHYRPMTLPEEMDLLYFSKEELEELERDRDERIYEEQFEVVTGRDHKDVAVTYPVRRIERPTRLDPVVEEPTISPPVSPPVSPPGLLDISSSWSSSSEKEQPEGYEV